MNAILALDAGTTNVKAILVDPQASNLARDLRRKGVAETIRSKTGPQVDPLFPSSKIQWLF
jgi:glycerol kinase